MVRSFLRFSRNLSRAARSVPLVLLALSLFATGLRAAPIPAVEKLLPEDTLVLVTAPDFPKLLTVWNSTPQYEFWNDSSMKPFRENFVTRWTSEVVKPLERDFDVRLSDFFELIQGQVTVALLQNGKQSPSFVLLLDTKTKNKQAASILAKIKRKWSEAGKPLRSEKIRGFDFSLLTLSSNEIPSALKDLIPSRPQLRELGPNGEIKEPEPPKTELAVGMAESLLVVATHPQAAEKVLLPLTGSAVPALADLASYQSSHLALFRDAPLYAWLNTKALIEGLSRRSTQTPRSDIPDPLPMPKPEKFFEAAGIANLSSIAVAIRHSNEGAFLQCLLANPDSTRKGLFKFIAGEPRESSPPPFVPADAVKFRRWRLDSQKAWAEIEKMFNEYDPRLLSSINFVIETAGARAKEKDPGFDLKKLLIGNLGDDLITYEKAPRTLGESDVNNPPSITLLSSPNAEELLVALKTLFVIFPGADAATEREFLGRKVLSTPLPNLPLPLPPGVSMGAARTLHYAASGGYIAFSTDAPLVEEYLRSSDSQGKALRESPGLNDAAQKVTGPGTGLFGFENQAETMRVSFEAARTSARPATNAPPGTSSSLPSAFGLPTPDRTIKEWMDFSLLPPFEKVARYFDFTVYSVGANSDGVTFKWFSPAPAPMKKAVAEAAARQ